MLIKRKHLVLVIPVIVSGLLFGCASEPALVETPESSTGTTPTSAPESATAAPVETEPNAVSQEASCGWDVGPATWSGEMPGRQPDSLVPGIVGAWQHTHVNDGGGMKPVSGDIRYIFPSENEMIYCQDIPGITDKAEQPTLITIADNRISPPAPHPGFDVMLMDENTMVWINNLDGSSYVLVRR